MKTIAIIGGGPAGMMAAAAAASSGAVSVILLEKNEKLGKKLYLTGKGRCNITNATDIAGLMKHVIRNPRFLHSAFHALDADALMAFIEGLGVPLKIERGNRVFPVSDKANDINRALEKRLEKLGVRVMLRTVVENIDAATASAAERISQCTSVAPATEGASRCTSVESATEGASRCTSVESATEEASQYISVAPASDGVSPHFYIRTSRGTVEANALVLATGGLSYPATGSTGEGFSFAQRLGHTVTPTSPSLVPLLSDADWLPELEGLSLRNVRLIARLPNGKVLYEETGEMLFTGAGVSGPLVLRASAYLTDKMDTPPTPTLEIKPGLDTASALTINMKSGSENTPTHTPGKNPGPDMTPTLTLDMKPGLDTAQLDARIIRDFTEAPNKDFTNALGALLPARMVNAVTTLCKIPGNTKVNAITKTQRANLVHTLKNIPIPLTATAGYKEAVITRGGINTREINPSTLMSKKIPGLFFAGECIDTDALTGGYNLQIAFSTGHLAGMSAAKFLDT